MEAALADAVVVTHLAYILFVALGGLLVARWPKLVWAHLPAVAWGLYVELANEPCPLTPLENRLRELAGDRGYEETFIEHYVLPWIYLEGLTRNVQLSLAAAIVLLNLVTYSVVHRCSRSRKQRQTAGGDGATRRPSGPSPDRVES